MRIMLETVTQDSQQLTMYLASVQGQSLSAIRDNQLCPYISSIEAEYRAATMAAQ